MKKYNYCKKILEKDEFEKMIDFLTEEIIKEKGKEILINEYISILDEKIEKILWSSRNNKKEVNKEYNRFIEKIREKIKKN